MRHVFVLLLLLSGVAAPVVAQEPAPALDASARHAAIDSVAALVERYYAVPDTGALIAEGLRARLRAGEYDSLRSPPELAEAVTRDMQAIHADWHMNLRFAPDQAASLAAPEATDAEGAAARERIRERMRRENFGVSGARILEGNVGWVGLTVFYDEPEAYEAVASALELVGHTDAVILDVSEVPGGSAGIANFLISHFTPPDVPSLEVYYRPEDRTEHRSTLDWVPGPRRMEVPLYVLVSGLSASAAEDVAFVLQNLDRATIVGSSTAGAGRNNRFYAVGHGLVLSVSVSRVMEPGTGREWESVGVEPDVVARRDEVLAVAHLEALERIAETHPDRSQELAMAREFVEARRNPPRIDPASLERWIGEYERGAEVVLEDGALWVSPRPGMPAVRLVPISESRFAAGATSRVSFETGPGGTPRMTIVWRGRSPEVLERMD